jgi:hypothetical protein
LILDLYVVSEHRMDLERFLAELDDQPAGRASRRTGTALATAAAETALSRSTWRTGRFLATDALQAANDSPNAQKKKLLSLLVTPDKASPDAMQQEVRGQDNASDDEQSVESFESLAINHEERLQLARSLRLASDDALLREAMEVSSVLTALSPTRTAGKDTLGHEREWTGRARGGRYLSNTPRATHPSNIVSSANSMHAASPPLRARGRAVAWTADNDFEDEDGVYFKITFFARMLCSVY